MFTILSFILCSKSCTRTPKVHTVCELSAKCFWSHAQLKTHVLIQQITKECKILRITWYRFLYWLPEIFTSKSIHSCFIYLWHLHCRVELRFRDVSCSRAFIDYTWQVSKRNTISGHQFDENKLLTWTWNATTRQSKWFHLLVHYLICNK